MNRFLKLCSIFIHLPSLIISLDSIPLNAGSPFFEFDDNDLGITAKYQNVQLPKSIGQIVGIAVNTTDNSLVIFHRGERIWNANSFNENNIFNSSVGPIKQSTLLIFNPETGEVVKEGGANQFYMPHGLYLDQDSNIWVTDIGLHQVFKLDSNLKVQLTLGEKLVPGSNSDHFCMPTDVAVTKAGVIFVSDGYCNSRIMKFDQSGKFIKSFGQPNGRILLEKGLYEDSVEDALLLPHSLTIDEEMNMLCVADREDRRILCYSIFGRDIDDNNNNNNNNNNIDNNNNNNNNGQLDMSGELLTKVENVGRVYAIRFKEHLIFGVTSSSTLDPRSFDVFAMDLLTKRIKVIAEDVVNAHCIDTGNDGAIYVGQTGPNQVTKIVMESETERYELPSYF